MSQFIKQTFFSKQYLDQALQSTSYAFGHTANWIIDDFDKNGYLDLMSFPSNYAVSDGSYQFKPVAWMNTNGKFTATDTLVGGLTTQFSRDIITADFNGDGINDYITVDQGFEPNRDLPNASDYFKFYYPNLIIGTSGGLQFVSLEDWNLSLSTARVFNHIGDTYDYDADGDMDFAIASFGGGVKLYKNNGNLTFTDVVSNTDIPLLPNVSGLSFINVNGKAGLIAGMYSTSEPLTSLIASPPLLYIYENGKFTLSQTLSRLNIAGVDPYKFGMVDTENYDLNGDGREDLFMTWENAQGDGRVFASVYIQDVTGQLNKKSDFQLVDNSTLDSFWSDIDKDGDLDFFIIAGGSDGGFRITELDNAIFLNDGNGNFSHPTKFFSLVDYKSTRWQDKFGTYIFFDVNNDALLDVVAVSSIFAEDLTKNIGQEVTVFLNQSTTRVTSGNDKITGTNSNDKLYGVGGNDKIIALIGDDILDGGEGNDTLIGGDGDDTYYVDNAKDKVIESKNEGTDTVITSIRYRLPNNIENLVLKDFFSVSLEGNVLPNQISGNTGQNSINGGMGNDTLTGGSGNDTFVLNSKLGPSNVDTITDFASGLDKIALDDAIFSRFRKDKDLTDNFKVGTAASASSDYIIYDSANGKLYYDADGNGNAAAIQIALLGIGSHPTILANDFVII